MPVARVVALHAFSRMQPDRPASESLRFEVDGIVGDRHRGHLRPNGRRDKQPRGTMRRNERMWSAISTDELRHIADDMRLATALTAADITINIVFDGFASLSQLPRGSLLRFPSGLELIVEEYCAPCLSKGAELAARYRQADGSELGPTAFSKAAKHRRGLLGIVDVAGDAHLNDEVEIVIHPHPARRATD